MQEAQGTVAPDTATPMPDAQNDAQPVETGTTESVAEQQPEQQQDGNQKPEDQQNRRLRGVEKRISELTGTIHNERREKQQLVDIIKAFTGQQQQQPQQSGAPSWEDFKARGLPYEDFVAAKAEHAAVRKFEEYRERHTQETTRVQQEYQVRELGQRLAANHERSVQEFVKTHPDYSQVIDRDDIEIPNTAGALIQADPESAAIFYAIAKNPQYAAQLRQFDGNVVMQARVIGGIAARLGTTAPQVSNAPAPGKGVGSSTGSGSSPPEDPDAYMVWAKKHMR